MIGEKQQFNDRTPILRPVLRNDREVIGFMPSDWVFADRRMSQIGTQHEPNWRCVARIISQIGALYKSDWRIQ